MVAVPKGFEVVATSSLSHLASMSRDLNVTQNSNLELFFTYLIANLSRPGPLLPPVDEDEYVPIDDKDQDFHRQLLNLPLQSDVGSHDSHNDSGYSTRLGASAGPSPSLSGK